MKRRDNLKNKAIVLIASSLLTGILVLPYFLDNSPEWNYFKIYSCVIVNLRLFFMIPSVRNSYLLNEGKSLDEWFRAGFSFGAGGIAFPLLFAPYYGVRYYCGL
ncbi:MAG: hypothetical protein LBP26_05300 [Clostridiales bacterium]|nr:hypothetical protein [Clostridiales bacterium]